MPDATRPSRRDHGSERVRLVALPGGRVRRGHLSPLPSPVSSFIGRDDELGDIISMIQGHRLVTLTGPGGIGKTRLAFAVAGELADIFDGGLWVVELAAVTEPDQVARAVATAVEVGERPDQPLTETLTDVLTARTGLLVLDNCEHLIDPAATLTDTLLHGCPNLSVLATSREPLGITGEVAWSVPPLQQAILLFSDRAQAVRPSFVLDERTTPAVTRIVEQLDGVPLALELAAARVRMLTVDEIASRLGDALRLLVGDRSTIARHHTLAATVDWSHALLSPAEQVLFRRLSIFRGGFTLPAAEAVCAGSGLAQAEVFDRLAALVDKSLVVADQETEETRYRLLEVVRQYAEERRLAADGGDTDVPARHAAYFHDLAEEADRKSVGLGEPFWFDRIAAEHDNLRAALTWLAERTEDGPEAAELAGALGPFWFTRGFAIEGIGWIQAAVRRVGSGERASRAKAKALNSLVLLAAFQEDYALAWASGQEALALHRTLDDADGTAICLLSLSTTAVAGQLSEVDVPALVNEARSFEPRLRDRRVLGYLSDIEGALALLEGDVATAVLRWQQALALHRKIGNHLGEAFIMANLGLLSARLGDAEQAGPTLADTLRLSHRLDYKLIIQYCLIGMGKLAADAGQLHRAARLWGAADLMEEAYGAHLTKGGRAILDYEAQLELTRPRLAEPVWRTEWAEGRRMTTDQAVAYALDPESSAPEPATSPPGGLTAREMDVLRLVARGLTSADVGRQLFLSARTIDWHLSSIYTKLGVRSRTEAARFALDHGLG